VGGRFRGEGGLEACLRCQYGWLRTGDGEIRVEREADSHLSHVIRYGNLSSRTWGLGGLTDCERFNHISAE